MTAIRIFTYSWLYLVLVLLVKDITALNFVPKPSSLTIKHVNLKYPRSILRTLFSSVPEREYALRDICIDIDSESLVLLTGLSSSGKSALFKCLSSTSATHHCSDTKNVNLLEGAYWDGSIQINGQDVSSRNSNPILTTAKPIIVDRKFFGLRDDNKSVKEWLLSSFKRGEDISVETKSSYKALLEDLVYDMSEIFGLNEETLGSSLINLSPSTQFSVTLVYASIQSIHEQLIISSQIPDSIYYPILCLDELFDFEHGAVVSKVGVGLQKLSHLGGIVIAATHKPHQLLSVANRSIVLSGGKVIKDEVT